MLRKGPQEKALSQTWRATRAHEFYVDIGCKVNLNLIRARHHDIRIASRCITAVGTTRLLAMAIDSSRASAARFLLVIKHGETSAKSHSRTKYTDSAPPNDIDEQVCW